MKAAKPTSGLCLRNKLAVAVAAIGLSACTAQPLYAPDRFAPNGVNGSPFAGQVSFESPDSRLEQVVRNAMLFRLNGSGASAATDPVYNADLNIRSRNTGRFRTPDTSAGQTSAAVVTVTGTMTLTDPRTGEQVTRLTRSANAPYDRASQDFANERAQLDAENRAAEELAEQLSALLAAQLRTRQ